MAIYKVIATETIAHYYTVEATSEDDAENQVLEGSVNMDESKDINFEILEIDEE